MTKHLVLLLGFIAPAVLAQGSLEVISLRHRTVDQVSQAFISAGESRVFGEAATGFAVVPRISGSSVTVEVAAQQENFVRGGALQGQRAVSTVNGRLGEWIELGGASMDSARTDSGILSSRQRTTVENRRIWVKVEESR